MSNMSEQCSNDALEYFAKEVGLRRPILRVNALMVVMGILMGLMVGIGAYGHRYRHIPLIRFLYLAATTLFLPIVSYIVSSSGLDIGQSIIMLYKGVIMKGDCRAAGHVLLVLVWAALVLIIGINSNSLVAADAREGRSIPPNMTLLIQAVWTSYLGIYICIVNGISPLGILVILGPLGVIFAKLVLKCYAWYIARQSLAFGRSPRLIVGYMEKLQDGSHHAELASEHMPPPLIVNGEHTMKVQEKSCGYELNWMLNGVRSDMYSKDLVTFDKVWQLNGTLLGSKSLQLKELCFSFALFKLLRCRIARYNIIEVGFSKGRNFLGQILLEDSAGERVPAMIAHELSFLYDYYYSSLPISYSKSWLPNVSGFISVLNICYCIFIISMMIYIVIMAPLSRESNKGQISCYVYCKDISYDIEGRLVSFGIIYFDIIPACILAVLVMLTEARDIAFYTRSNWVKVGLVCQYVKHGSWPSSATMKRYVNSVLRSKGKLTRNWEDKMGQSSILVLHPGKNSMALLRHLIPLSGQNKKTPSAVKSAIVGALRKSYERGQINGDVFSFQRMLHLQDDNKIIWTFGERGTTEIMLVCHIATTLLGARSPLHKQPPFDSDNMSVANHLSGYCAYMAAHYPELLPEDDEWCKSLYKAVEKDAERVLVGNDFRDSAASELEYRRRLIELLSAEGNHEVLKDGARLAERLIGLTEEVEEMAWKALAVFWSEMVLYVAPSDNIDGHMKALARGGELITLLWALVTHLGVVGRSDDTTTDGANVHV
ncbi:hypothetical protein CFC21_090226 [Triticum aestivum]|uniref:DUF4220 domain-containing protein n=2 Tax=Triticum aestivum TaxID=4565 RepID=A0A3B6PT33_WHEAT|nr:uncharacterized protein LOC123135083 [Triticum aestivum]KAF7086998.1 hypothetical protein CFC21_090226 [Triticum aestivum]